MTYPDHPRHVTKPQMKRVPRHLTENARALRNGATETERLLWRKLSRYRPRFTRQLVVGPYIIDLACREARLGIELDGQHLEAAAYDTRRTDYLQSLGWRMIRFWKDRKSTRLNSSH